MVQIGKFCLLGLEIFTFSLQGVKITTLRLRGQFSVRNFHILKENSSKTSGLKLQCTLSCEKLWLITFGFCWWERKHVFWQRGSRLHTYPVFRQTSWWHFIDDAPGWLPWRSLAGHSWDCIVAATVRPSVCCCHLLHLSLPTSSTVQCLPMLCSFSQALSLPYHVPLVVCQTLLFPFFTQPNVITQQSFRIATTL